MKVILSILICSCVFWGCGNSDQPLYVDSISEESEVLEWDSVYRLKRSDFRSPINGNEEFDAGSKTGIWSFHRYEGDRIVIVVHALFNRENSYFKSDSLNEELLNHEQMHFNITEYYARQVRKAVFYWPGPGDIESFTYHCQDSLIPLMDSVNHLYDLETNHGLNKLIQLKWSRKIDSLLNATDSFVNPVVKVEANRGLYWKD
jgi:hypothetical protein